MYGNELAIALSQMNNSRPEDILTVELKMVQFDGQNNARETHTFMFTPELFVKHFGNFRTEPPTSGYSNGFVMSDYFASLPVLSLYYPVFTLKNGDIWALVSPDSPLYRIRDGATIKGWDERKVISILTDDIAYRQERH